MPCFSVGDDLFDLVAEMAIGSVEVLIVWVTQQVFFLGVILSTLKHSLSPTRYGDSAPAGRSVVEALSSLWRCRYPNQGSAYGVDDMNVQAGGPVIAGD